MKLFDKFNKKYLIFRSWALCPVNNVKTWKKKLLLLSLSLFWSEWTSFSHASKRTLRRSKFWNLMSGKIGQVLKMTREFWRTGLKSTRHGLEVMQLLISEVGHDDGGRFFETGSERNKSKFFQFSRIKLTSKLRNWNFLSKTSILV